MVDTTKTVKSANDKELYAILNRLRMEREALRSLRDLKIQSTPNPKGPYPSYSTSEAFSTETIVWEGKSIKDMTNEELGTYLSRLRNENELVNIIRDIQSLNNPTPETEDMYPKETPYEGVSLNTPVTDLYHFGIPGMRWGSRRGSSVSTGKKDKVKTLSDDYMNARILKKNKVSSLSTADLKKLNERLQLEKTFQSLNPGKYERAHNFVKGILAAGATVASAYALMQTPAGKRVKAAFRQSAAGYKAAAAYKAAYTAAKTVTGLAK